MSSQIETQDDDLMQDWFHETEGQLSVDVIELQDAIIVRSAIAGVAADDLDISLSNDTLTIRGKRHEKEAYQHGAMHVKECHWGIFSRSIVLPCAVNSEEVDAVLQKGVLTITIKKMDDQIQVSVLDLEDL